MKWKLDKSRPICPQMCEQLCVAIATGEYTAESRLPSVRDIAVTAGVNPNTVQKSMELLEGSGIIYSIRGTGWFVAKDIKPAKEKIKSLYREYTKEYFNSMSNLGLTAEQTKKYIKEWKE